MHYEYVHEKWCDRQDKLGLPRAFRVVKDPQPADKSAKEGETVSQDSRQTPQSGLQLNSVDTTELLGTQKENSPIGEIQPAINENDAAEKSAITDADQASNGVQNENGGLTEEEEAE